MEITEMLLTINENVDEVHEAGYSRGETAGFDAGKQAEYDAFWDAYQQNGNRTDYGKGFCGNGWNDETFKPKYDIVVVGAANDFIPSNRVTDIVASLNACGVELDLSECTSLSWGMSTMPTTRLPVLNVPKVTTFNSCFYGDSYLHTIEKIILNEQGNQVFSNAFYDCKALENIVFEGVIGQDIDFKKSTKLSKASITNIINHLSDTAREKTLTLSKTAVENAFAWYDSDGNKQDSLDGLWCELIESKSNWTITLV